MSPRNRVAKAAALASLVLLAACKQVSLDQYFQERIAETVERSGNPPPAPARPTLSSATGSIAVSWPAVQGARSYQVWIAENGDSGSARLGAEPEQASATIEGLQNGIAYFVWIKAVNLAGAGPFSDAGSASPIGIPALGAAAADDSCIDLSWSPAPGASAYDVYASTANDISSALLMGQDVSGTSYRITGLLNDVPYWCWAVGKRPGGKGSASEPLSATPFAATSVPEKPGIPVLAATATGTLTVSWPVIAHATLYKVRYGSDTDFASSLQWGGPTTSLSASIAGLLDGARYYVWICAWNSLGDGEWSGAATMLTLPAAPPGVVAVAGAGALSVSWSPAASAIDYELRYGSGDDASAAQAWPSNPTGTSLELTGLEAGVTYSVWVRARNDSGSGAYGVSAPVTTVPPAPGAPSLAATAAGSLALSWAAARGASSYELYYASSDSLADATTWSADLSEPTATITGLLEGTVYHAWVKAKNAAGAGPVSASASLRTLPAAPGTPTVAGGTGQLGVSWGVVEGASSYELWYGTNAASASASLWGEQPASPSATITGLSSGATYYVWIKARNESGASGLSAPGLAVTAPPAPAAPAVMGGTGRISASWAATAGATSYEVWYGTGADPASAALWPDQPSSPAVTITGLATETKYYVWIKAMNSSGKSGLSEAGTASTTPPSADSPSVTGGAGKITVDWPSIPNAIGYQVWYGNSTDSAAASLWSEPTTAGSVVITGLAGSTTYYAWIRVKTAGGTGGFGLPGSGMTAPDAPGAPTVTGGSAQASASWTAAAGASSYEVWYGASGDPAGASLWTTQPISPSVTISGLANGTTYYVWIKAKNASGASGFSAAGSAMTIPAAPGAPTVTGGSGQVGASWSGATGATSYEVWYGTSNNSAAASLWTTQPSSPGATVTGLASGTTYYLWVKAKNVSGASGFSGAGSAITIPAAPSGPTVTGGSGQVTATWSGVAGATQYEVYYKQTTSLTDTSGASTYSTTLTGTSATIGSLSSGLTYCVWVKAKNGTGASGLSGGGSAITVPAAPTGPTVTGGSGQVTATWSGVAGATQYEVYYKQTTTLTDTSGASTYSTTLTGTSATIGSLSSGLTYCVWVKAKNGAGVSALSGGGSAITVPAAPAGPTVTGGSAQVTATWALVTGATQYEVYYKQTTSLTDTSGASTYSTTLTGTSATIGSLSNGLTYCVWVKAKNGTGVSALSGGGSAITIPAAPAGPTVTGGASQVTATWTGVTGVTQYEVYYKQTTTNSTTGASTYSTTFTGTTATIGSLSSGLTYYVWVKAKNGSGVSGFSPGGSAITIPAAPGAPTVSSPASLNLSATWTTVTGAASFDVYRNTANNSATATLTNSSVTTLPVTHGALSADTTYYYWIKAKNGSGTSGFSSAGSGRPIPAAPAAPTLTKLPSFTVQVTWTLVNGATSYEVWRKVNSTDPTGGTVYTTTTNLCSFGSLGPLPVYFWLKSINAGGTSGFSSYSVVTPTP